MLSVQGVHFGYGSKPVLQGLGLHLDRGEMVGLVGPNGSGKSTLLKLVSGVLRPQGGAIFIKEQDTQLLSTRQWARLVAVVPQNPVVPAHFTALEMVLMGRTPHLGLLQWEGTGDTEAVERAMRLTRCWELAHQPMGKMSGGERQRVLIARALAQEAPLLLLDEPTASLDLVYQTHTFDLVQQLQRTQGLTVLVAIHDLTLAAQYCHRLALLHRGAIHAEGHPEEVLTPEQLRTVYGAEVVLVCHPVTGLPVVLPVPTDGRDSRRFS